MTSLLFHTFLLLAIALPIAAAGVAAPETQVPTGTQSNTTGQPPSAVEPPTIDVWPGLAPGEHTSNPGRIADKNGGVTRLTDITCPKLLMFPAEGKGPHATVMVCPGGGYGILAADLEGSEIAKWLNDLGISAAVLHYRVPGNRDRAFQDAQRALSVLRSRAGELSIDPAHLGVLGFSAGGHLSARIASGFAKRAYETIDTVDQVSCRPDFAVLVYPAWLMDKAANLPAAEVRPGADTPPIFIVQTEDDPFFCAPDYSKALDQVGVPNRCVTYKKGGHGYGLRAPKSQPVHAWAGEAAAWIKERVGLTKATPPAP